MRATAARQDETASRDPLLRFASDPTDLEVRAFAAAIETARSSALVPGGARFGLSMSEFSLLLDRHFPGSRAAYGKVALAVNATATDEFNDLVALLLAHRSDDSDTNRWLAYAIATCCLGEDHLWQDLGMPDRQALSGLLAHRFTALYRKNTGNMRWKKFFYKQLCEQRGARVCRSPSCAECVDYTECFGSEEELPWQGRVQR